MAEKEVRKTTTKKPVKKTAPKKVASKAVPASKTPRRKPASKTPVRKAPTAVAQTKQIEKKSNIVLIFGLVFFALVVGGSIALGISGDGEISIETRIADIRENATPEERSIINSIPVQKVALPDGGLVPSGVPDAVPEPKPTASSSADSATSTDATATTTSETTVSEEGGEIEDPTFSEGATSTENVL